MAFNDGMDDATTSIVSIRGRSSFGDVVAVGIVIVVVECFPSPIVKFN